MSNLVIVESPTKARTLSRFLGDGYQIEASIGHIRDLPKSELGVEIEKDFEPQYVIPRDKRKRVNELKKLADKSDKLWLATDPDREGEAIAWHLQHLLGDKKQQIKRVEFHEITPEAIKEAFQNPRQIDMKLVDAQQARRILDRIVGYKLSPLLWKKIKRGLSAGRVQSIALRLIVEREREIEAFKPIEYWSIDANLGAKNGSFWAVLYGLNGEKLEVHNKAEADTHVKALESAQYSIEKITKKEVRRHPAPPFTTSTLQQTAGNRLHLSAKKTMMLAQNLYERGLITYMRTDSVNLAQSALAATREVISKMYGGEYLPPQPNFYKAKVKNAQEAHEAIRPTDMGAQEIKDVDGLGRDHARLYELIWKRTAASQMNSAVFDSTTVDVAAQAQTDKYSLRATGSVIKFDGWLKVYGVKELDEENEQPKEGEKNGAEDRPADDSMLATQPMKNQVLPELSENESPDLKELKPDQHFTEPPPRYTEASLIKKLEELGIGRPSTYAPILSTIEDRYYVEREQRKFKPSSLGLAVNDFLLEHFPKVFDYQFTASMEDKLDSVSRGEEEWRRMIGEFYAPFETEVEKTAENAKRVELTTETVDKKCPKCGKDLIIRFGRFGKFLACSGFPDCKHTEAIESQVEGVKCPDDGGEIVVRKTKKGRTFYGCKNWPKCKFASWTRPRSSGSAERALRAKPKAGKKDKDSGESEEAID